MAEKKYKGLNNTYHFSHPALNLRNEYHYGNKNTRRERKSIGKSQRHLRGRSKAAHRVEQEAIRSVKRGEAILKQRLREVKTEESRVRRALEKV